MRVVQRLGCAHHVVLLKVPGTAPPRHAWCKRLMQSARHVVEQHPCRAGAWTAGEASSQGMQVCACGEWGQAAVATQNAWPAIKKPFSASTGLWLVVASVIAAVTACCGQLTPVHCCLAGVTGGHRRPRQPVVMLFDQVAASAACRCGPVAGGDGRTHSRDWVVPQQDRALPQ